MQKRMSKEKAFWSKAISKSSHVPEITGLRGIAVLMVIFDHFDLIPISGGFIGVDIFFVISGYLITGIIYKEYYESQLMDPKKATISISKFYIRRARRILPAANFTLILVIFWYAATTNTVRLEQIAKDAFASVLFSANNHFSRINTDYFSLDIERSPLLHYWSLSIEEQFYFVWPFFLLTFLTKHKLKFKNVYIRWNFRILFATVLISVISFVLSLVNFENDPTNSYFLTQNRVWELGLGGTFAILAKMKILIFNSKYDKVINRISLITVIISCVVITPKNFGYMIIFPVLATCLYIITSQTKLDAYQQWRGLGANKILLYLGTISYSLYLTHWPLLIVSKENFASNTLLMRSTLFILCVLISHFMFKFVETPFLKKRKHTKIQHKEVTSSRSPTFYGTISMVIVLLLSSSSYLTELSTSSNVSNQAKGVDLDVLFPKLGEPSTLEQKNLPNSLNSKTWEPNSSDLSRAVFNWENDLIKEMRNGSLTKETLSLLPTVITERNVYESMCFDKFNNPCEIYRADNANKTVILLGDSQMLMLLEPLVRFFENAQGWRVLNWAIRSCSTIAYSIEESADAPCGDRQVYVKKNLVREKPNLVIVAEGSRSKHQYDINLRNYLNQVVPNKYIQILPWGNLNTPPEQCFERNGQYNLSCFKMNSTSLRSVFQSRQMHEAWGTRLIDLNQLICKGSFCPPIHNGTLVFRDRGHLSVEFSRQLSEIFGLYLSNLVPETF